MNGEKIILSIIGISGGLLVAGIGFYFYQSHHTLHTPTKNLKISATLSPTPGTKSGLILTIDSPTDESVVKNQTITINGKTTPQATVLISTAVADQVATASASGDFTTTTTLDTDTNEIVITSIAPDGTEITKKVTVTYSTENF